MALENTVAKYTVQIVQDGTTAPAIAEFNNLRAAAQNAASGTSTATSGLKEFRETATLTRESTRVLAEASILLGGNLGEVAKGALAASEGLRAVRTASMLTGVGLGTILEAVAGIGVALGAGFELWEIFGDHLETAEEKAKKLAEGLTGLKSIIPELFQLQGQYPLNFAIGGLPGNAETANSPADLSKFINNGQGNPDPQAIARLQKALSQSGYLINNGTDAKPDYEVDPRIIAAQKLDELQKQITQDALTGYNKETSAADALFQKQIDQARQLAAMAGNKITPGALQATEDAALKTHNATIQNAQAAIDDESARQELEDDKKLDEQWNKMVEDARNLGEAKQTALDQVATKEKSLQSLENQIKQAIEDTTNAWIAQFDKLAKELGMSEQEIADWNAQAQQAADSAQQSSQDASEGIESMGQMGDEIKHRFAVGFADAFVDFVDGTKSAKQAFGEFAVSFLQDTAKMLAEQAMLRLVFNAFGGGGTATATTNAFGGVTFAASGLAGVGDVSSPTYFPRFNVLAGEQGREMLTVLARPTFRSIGGMDAVVGMAGNNRLAITNADDLANRGGGGAGGTIHIKIDHTPETQATIVNNSIRGAVTEVTRQMKRSSPISAAVKELTA